MTHKDVSTELSNTHVVIWEGRDTLHMFSAHKTISFIDHRVFNEIPKRYFFTLDSELDKIIPEHCSSYCPQPDDAMVIVEATSEKQRSSEPKRTDIQEFCEIFWRNTQGSMGYWKFFSEEIIDSIDRKLLGDRRYMDDAEIRYAKQSVLDALLDAYPNSMSEKEVSAALELLHAVRLHPQAEQMKELIDETSRSIQGMTAPLLEELYQDAILCCIEHRVHRWWSFFPNAKFDSVPVLQHFLRECLLRRAGDYQEFLRIRKQLKQLSSFSAQERFYDSLVRHFAHAMKRSIRGCDP